jgi:hypothetical protein
MIRMTMTEACSFKSLHGIDYVDVSTVIIHTVISHRSSVIEFGPLTSDSTSELLTSDIRRSLIFAAPLKFHIADKYKHAFF